MESTRKCVLCQYDKDTDEIIRMHCGSIVCWTCLHEYVRERIATKIPCLVEGCSRFLKDNEIRKTLSVDDIKLYEEVCINSMYQIRQCLLATECGNRFLIDDPKIQIDCAKCTLFQCLMCKAAHRYSSCQEYQAGDGDSRRHCEEEMNRVRKIVLREKAKRNRKKLIRFEEKDLLKNKEAACCEVCTRSIAKSKGVYVRCGATFCRDCLVSHIESSSIPVPSPLDEEKFIEDREILAVLSDQQMASYLKRCLAEIMHKFPFSFSCKSGDCGYFCELASRHERFSCLRCKMELCFKCRESHSDQTCEQHIESIKHTPRGKQLAELEEQIKNRKLMRCCNCFNMIRKTEGCNWIQCNVCKMELCWILQIPRWGPKGRGDTSGGCRCGVEGPCDPRCTSSCIPHQENVYLDNAVHSRDFAGLLQSLRILN